MTERVAPASAPYPPAVQSALEKIMPPGVPPLRLFTTLARDERLFSRFFGASLLDKGHLTLRQRELIIDRTTALCGSEYEWGVHVAFFGARAGLTSEQVSALVHGQPEDACWSPEDRLVLRLCDALHQRCTIDDTLWADLRERFAEEALIEMLMLAGLYRTVSYLTNGLCLPLEMGAAVFPARRPS
jgi:alkylhydroperoxidase family enzyme